MFWYMKVRQNKIFIVRALLLLYYVGVSLSRFIRNSNSSCLGWINIPGWSTLAFPGVWRSIRKANCSDKEILLQVNKD